MFAVQGVRDRYPSYSLSNSHFQDASLSMRVFTNAFQYLTRYTHRRFPYSYAATDSVSNFTFTKAFHTRQVMSARRCIRTSPTPPQASRHVLISSVESTRPRISTLLTPSALSRYRISPRDSVRQAPSSDARRMACYPIKPAYPNIQH